MHWVSNVDTTISNNSAKRGMLRIQDKSVRGHFLILGKMFNQIRIGLK